MQGLKSEQTWTKAQDIWVQMTELEDHYIDKKNYRKGMRRRRVKIKK